MLVIGVIGILAALALPNLLRSRLQANEGVAIENLRVIASAQVAHNAAKNTYGTFAQLISEDDGPGTGYLDNTWSEGVEKIGYRYTIAEAGAADYVCFAAPVSPGVTGERYFRIDGSGIVRFSRGGPPAADAPPVAR